jgi:hypothetical protein
MTQWFNWSSIILLAVTAPLAAQRPAFIALAVTSCPHADSLLGPLNGPSPTLPARTQGNGVFFSIADTLSAKADAGLSVEGLFTAGPSDLPIVRHPTLVLTVTGKGARQVGPDGEFGEVRFVLDGDTVLGKGKITQSYPNSPGPAMGIVNMWLTEDTVARIVAAQRAELEIGQVAATLQPAFRARFAIAYRLSLCGYGRLAP